MDQNNNQMNQNQVDQQPDINNQQAQNNSYSSQRSRKSIMVIIFVVVLMVIGMGAYILLANNQNGSLPQSFTSQPDNTNNVPAGSDPLNAPEDSPEAIFNLEDPEEDLMQIEKELQSL